MGPPMGVNAGILYTMQCTQLYAATGRQCNLLDPDRLWKGLPLR